MDRAAELRVIEGVQRLTELQHHVVGHIHQRTDRADAAAHEALLHPVGRRRLGVHTADDPAAVTRASFRRIKNDRTRLVVGRRHDFAGRQAERTTGQGRHFAGNAGKAQAVGTIRRQLDREQGVVKLEEFPQVDTDRGVLRQHQQAAALIRKTELLGRAKHAKGFDTTQLGRLDTKTSQVGANQRTGNPDSGSGIGGATDNLQQLALPGIHLADTQFVGIRMLFRLDDLRNHHFGEHGGDAALLFHFQPRHGEQMPQRVRIEGRTDETAQPEF